MQQLRIFLLHIEGFGAYYSTGGKDVYKILKTGYIMGSSLRAQLIQKAARVTYESKLWKI